MGSPYSFIQNRLTERRLAGNYRELKNNHNLVDFCSNDYFGFARSAELKRLTGEEVVNAGLLLNGSTGSRLLSGNSDYIEALETEIADLHGSQAGLIFNSGYDANVGLFSSLPQRGDTIITDELIHASVIDGARLSYANRYTFKHNDLNSLEEKLKHARGICYVVIESVYSMDGDIPPIAEILHLTESYDASLIVDEAHAVGLFGFGLVAAIGLQSRVFARIVTFSKALGCHGAVILGGESLKKYLINFARSFIYTTAAAPHQLASVRMAYRMLQGSAGRADALRQNICNFRQLLAQTENCLLIQSDSTIQCLVLKSNKKAIETAAALKHAGLDVRAVLSPTVPSGSERIRICLHTYNTAQEITLLTDTLNNIMDAV